MGKSAPTLCPRLVESWLNEPAGRQHVVLGRRLRPFCLHHQFLLQAIGSPLVTPGAAPALADVEAAVRICRSRYRTPLARILPLAPDGPFTRRLHKVRSVWRAARHPLHAALVAFDRYLRDYMAPPEFWEQEAGGAAEVLNRFPVPLTLAVALLAGGRFGGTRRWFWTDNDNEAAVWQLPLGQAHWYAAGFAKQAGADLRLRTESDQFLNQMRALQTNYERWKATRKKRPAKQRKFVPPHLS